MTGQEGAVDDTRQACSRQRDKRVGRECDTSGWQSMQGDWAVNNTTRGGGQRTPCKTIGQWTTQNERQEQTTWGNRTRWEWRMPGDWMEVNMKRGEMWRTQQGHGQHVKRRGAEDPMRRQMTQQSMTAK
jgi:hypothetical protein